MASLTPSRRVTTTRTYYADPKSPIASTPQGSRKTREAASTPYMASLSPMHRQDRVRARRTNEHGASGDVPAGRSGGLFSPTAHYDDETIAEVAKTGATRLSDLRAGTAGTATPILSPPPVARTHSTSSSSSPASQDTAVAVSMTLAAAEAVAGSSSSGAAIARLSYEMEHPGEMSTALSAKQAADLARRVSAAHAAIEATDDWESYEEYNPYLFIRLLPPYPTVRPRVARTVLPPKARVCHDISLILDLDETLVHCSVEPIPDPDVTFPVMFGGQTYQVYVRKRPFLERFLARVSERFEVTVFTASQSVYAEKLLDIIDPEGRYITHRLYRESCLNVDGNYVKDLNVLGRDLRKTLLVDNSPHAFGYQLDNGVPIESWFEDPDDRELLKLAWFLEKEVHGSADVRPVLRDKFRMRTLVESSHY